MRRVGLRGQLGLSLAAQAPIDAGPSAAAAGELVGDSSPIVVARGGMAVEIRIASGWAQLACDLSPSQAAELIADAVAGGADRARYRVVKEGAKP